MQMAHLADAVHPVAHASFGLGSQVICALRRLNVEHILKFLFAILQAQPAVDLLALIQIDDTLQLAAVLIRIVFEAKLLRYLALLQRKPATTPALQKQTTISLDFSHDKLATGAQSAQLYSRQSVNQSISHSVSQPTYAGYEGRSTTAISCCSLLGRRAAISRSSGE